MYMRKGFLFLILHTVLGCLVAQAHTPAALTTNEQDRTQFARHEATHTPSTNEIENSWTHAKEFFYQYHIDVGATVSFLAQRVAPAGKQTSIQAVYNPYVSWHAFESETWGSGEINLNYTFVHYWARQAATLQNRANLAVSINNFEDNQKNWAQFSYTHTLPQAWDFLSLTVGQYAIDDSDGTQFVDDQQTFLLHHSLSQNESALYPDSSFGAFAQATLNEFTFTTGYQDANNLTGEQIRLGDAFDGQYTTFGAVMWAPTFAVGTAQYGFLYYYQPSTQKRPGGGHGWSFNVQQNIGSTWAVFARANGATEGILPVKQSYALGGALLNPLGRNAQDALVFAVGHNRLSRQGLDNPAKMHPSETVLEAQWIWGLGKLVTLTPDLQIIPRAGLGNHPVAVFGLRTTTLL